MVEGGGGCMNVILLHTIETKASSESYAFSWRNKDSICFDCGILYTSSAVFNGFVPVPHLASQHVKEDKGRILKKKKLVYFQRSKTPWPLDRHKTKFFLTLIPASAILPSPFLSAGRIMVIVWSFIVNITIENIFHQAHCTSPGLYGMSHMCLSSVVCTPSMSLSSVRSSLPALRQISIRERRWDISAIYVLNTSAPPPPGIPI